MNRASSGKSAILSGPDASKRFYPSGKLARNFVQCRRIKIFQMLDIAPLQQAQCFSVPGKTVDAGIEDIEIARMRESHGRFVRSNGFARKWEITLKKLRPALGESRPPWSGSVQRGAFGQPDA